MKLKSLNKYIGFLTLIISFMPFTILAEEEIDIWNKEKKQSLQKTQSVDNLTQTLDKPKASDTVTTLNNIEVTNELNKDTKETKIFGIYDPEVNNFDLNMWSQTSAEDVRSSIKRINKIELSSISLRLFENTLYSFAYPPEGMEEKEFIDLKINWMIRNKRSDLIEEFLKQNSEFHNKKKIIQYLVDENIAKADINRGCEKISFIDKSIKDSYLEKFKIYCLVFNDKKNEAQLLYDILKEQNQSDKFFDDKINFLLGITSKTNEKINEDNLLNFYLSSITNKNFKYEPKKNTKKEIWEYLNAANLIILEDIEDKERIKDLEIAANQDQYEKKNIFDIYKRISFSLNSLINANNIYQTLDKTDARALIYQKYLLSDNNESKIKLLFLLEDLFKKDNLLNVYSQFMTDKLKEIDPKDVPKEYEEVIADKIVDEEDFKLGKIKYDDKILHRSRLIKYFTENTNQKKIQKDFNRIYKKIKKNRKYFFSAKDIALIESLAKDGLEIPKEIDYLSISKTYDVPSNLLKLSKNNQPAFLTLKIVEIIGEDEGHDLDPETIYFITHLLNQTNLKKLRNEVLISALPQRS